MKSCITFLMYFALMCLTMFTMIGCDQDCSSDGEGLQQEGVTDVVDSTDVVETAEEVSEETDDVTPEATEDTTQEGDASEEPTEPVEEPEMEEDPTSDPSGEEKPVIIFIPNAEIPPRP